MKKIFLATVMTSMTFAATTAQLDLRGVIGKVVSISVTAETSADGFDLTTVGNNDLVGTAYESSNSAAGYSVTVSSDNGGELQHTEGDAVAYTLTYGGSSVDLAAGTTFNNTPSPSVVTDETKAIAISYAAQDAATLPSGDYTDIVRLEIAAN